jgi:outer membrane protein TolC
LQLAGASNLQIQLAAERVREAYARLDGAKALWIPSINAGIGYTKHDGRIQATEGQVLEVTRGSLFGGGGAVLSSASLAGGSGGPARLVVDISPVDIYFEPLAARQAAEASQADEVSTFNDTLLMVVLAYLELERGQWQVAIANEAVKNADRLARLTENFADTGVGLEADAVRARAELANRRRQLLESQARVRVVSAELARLLRLDPKVTLFAVGSEPVPVIVISDGLSLEDLIAQALSTRPELSHDQAVVAETLHRLRQEQWRPWLPNIYLGASGGSFGGGEGSFLGNFGGRSDFDALAVWELRNLGFGNQAFRRERESHYRQAHLAHQQTAERIAAEVTRAYQQTQFLKQQVEQARLQVGFALEGLPLNFDGIRGGELRPIEAQQAITGLAAARRNYLQAIIDYNQAQFRLLRAVGQTPDSMPTDAHPEMPPLPSDDE